MKKRLLPVILVIIMLLTAILVGCVNYEGPLDKSLYIAHRGYSLDVVDNTEKSFTLAGEKDFYGIETDVWLTKDGVYVCNHDATAKFEDGSELTIRESTYEELSKNILKGGTDETEKICLFSKYLEICNKYSKQAIVELKDIFNEEELKGVFALIEKHYSIDKATFISFDLEQLKISQKLHPEIEYQYLVMSPFKLNEALDNKMSISIHKILLTKSLVKKYHEAGLKVGVWTVDEEKDREKCLAYGADYITSNVLHKTKD